MRAKVLLVLLPMLVGFGWPKDNRIKFEENTLDCIQYRTEFGVSGECSPKTIKRCFEPKLKDVEVYEKVDIRHKGKELYTKTTKPELVWVECEEED